MKEFYTIPDIALMTGLNERTIRGYLADGRLKGDKADGAWRFTAEQFGDFLSQDGVRASVQAKANAVVYDFLTAGRRQEKAACLILDCPATERDEPPLRESLEARINALGLRWAYQYREGMARSILSGPPAALGELLEKLG